MTAISRNSQKAINSPQNIEEKSFCSRKFETSVDNMCQKAKLLHKTQNQTFSDLCISFSEGHQKKS
jgi:hypothetical protein